MGKGVLDCSLPDMIKAKPVFRAKQISTVENASKKRLSLEGDSRQTVDKISFRDQELEDRVLELESRRRNSFPP